MKNNKSALLTFLEPHVRRKDAKDKDKDKSKQEKRITHTWFGSYIQTFNVPEDKYEELYSLVQSEYSSGRPVHLIERFQDPSILKIDLDFEFQFRTQQRAYTIDHVKDIIRVYNKILTEYIEVPVDNILAYIFERTKGYRDKGKYKDGIHIMYPEITLDIPTQKFIREQFLKVAPRVFQSIPLTNRKYEDVVDGSIIDRNGWMVYGSTKPAREPYLLTHIYNVHMDDLELPEENVDLVKKLAMYDIDGNREVFKVKSSKMEEFQPKVDKDLEKKKRAMARREFNGDGVGGAGGGRGVGGAGGGEDGSMSISDGGTVRKKARMIRRRARNTDDELDMVKRLVGLLTDYRAHVHDTWIEVGICLYNIDDSLLETWIEFSKRSDKFVHGECEQKWMSFRNREEGELGIGSLHHWAMLDDPVGYEEIKRGSLTRHLRESLNCKSFTVAKVAYEMWKYNYVCISLKHNAWMKFEDHRWHESEHGVDLMARLLTDLLHEYLALNRTYLTQAMEVQGQNKQYFIDSSRKLLDVADKLQDVTFKDKLMRELRVMFYIPKFVDKLDTNPYLICFENGVYDLRTSEFRDGRFEDFCSLCTNTEYLTRDQLEDEDVESVERFLREIFPIERVRNYAKRLLGSFLLGKNPHERFHVWTGAGRNGKSKLVDLLKKAIGEYAGSVSIALFTQKRAASNAATPEVAKLRGLRFVDLAEPERGDKLNMGMVKQYSGGDDIEARPMYRDPVTFKPMFNLNLLCNDLPELPSDDYASWERIRVLKFISTFTKNPKGEHEYMIDTSLSDKFDDWKEAFMWILLQEYKGYLKNKSRIDEPPEVMEATREYQKKVDVYTDFLDSTICKGDKTDVIRRDEFYFKYKSWHAQNYGGKSCDNSKKFMEYMEKKLGKYNPSTGWTGIKFIPAGGNDDVDTDLEDSSNDENVTASVDSEIEKIETKKKEEDGGKGEVRSEVRGEARGEEAKKYRSMNLSRIKIRKTSRKINKGGEEDSLGGREEEASLVIEPDMTRQENDLESETEDINTSPQTVMRQELSLSESINGLGDEDSEIKIRKKSQTKIKMKSSGDTHSSLGKHSLELDLQSTDSASTQKLLEEVSQVEKQIQEQSECSLDLSEKKPEKRLKLKLQRR